MNWPLYFKNRRNKILAITLASLAVGFFLAYVVLYYVMNGGAMFSSSSSIIRLIYFILEGGILAYLLVTNVNNDPRAYQAILMWVFWFLVDEVFTLIYSSSVINIFSSSVSIPVAILALSQPFLALASLGLSVTLYIFVRRYMFHRTEKFKIIRILAIAYAGLTLATGLLQIGLIIASGGVLTLADIFAVACKLCADLAVVFTLERLRR